MARLGFRAGRRLSIRYRSGASRPLGARPRISAVSPNTGPSAGGTSVTITGINFTDATAINFGSNSAAFTVVSDTQITATSPAGSGTAFITVTTPEGVSFGFPFVYAGAPVVTGVSPNSGPLAGGTNVTISGSGFTGATAVVFGANPAASFTFVSASQITAVSPSGVAGAINVRVTTPEGTSAIAAGNQFTYLSDAPTITAVAPNTGDLAGGTSVVIIGTNFTGVTAVNFGGTVLSPIAAPGAPTVASINPTSGAAGTPVTITGTGFLPVAGFTFVSATQINVVTPAGSGAANVTVTTPNGTSAPPATFTYASQAPTVASINPTSGPAGTLVTITGTGFA